MTGKEFAGFALRLHREIVAKFGPIADFENLEFIVQRERVVIWENGVTFEFGDTAVAYWERARTVHRRSVDLAIGRSGDLA